MPHKFKIGQTVNYRPAKVVQDAPWGTYQIAGFLPQRNDGEIAYRILSLEEGYERVARESELRPVG
jgi:hypothetical protein